MKQSYPMEPIETQIMKCSSMIRKTNIIKLKTNLFISSIPSHNSFIKITPVIARKIRMIKSQYSDSKLSITSAISSLVKEFTLNKDLTFLATFLALVLDLLLSASSNKSFID